VNPAAYMSPIPQAKAIKHRTLIIAASLLAHAEALGSTRAKDLPRRGARAHDAKEWLLMR